jgi:hypothetical protein
MRLATAKIEQRVQAHLWAITAHGMGELSDGEKPKAAGFKRLRAEHKPI